MFLIVGLGNPGTKYTNTRHNLGFMVVDHFAKTLGATFSPAPKFQGEIAKLPDLILLKPHTFMNLSGASVAQVANYYRIPAANIFVTYDELDLPFGTLRFRESGSHGGHNGMRSIIQHLGTTNFPRLRLGIGRPETSEKSASDHVLAKFTTAEKSQLQDTIEAATVYIASKVRHN